MNARSLLNCRLVEKCKFYLKRCLKLFESGYTLFIMANRQETREQQKSVEQALRALLVGGSLKPGEMLPTVSAVAQQHGVSRYIAHRALQVVEAEGLFHAVAKVGSFAGTGESQSASFQVFLIDDASLHPYATEIQIGFDSRVAARGGVALSLELSQANDSWRDLKIDGAFLLVREERLDDVLWRGLFDESVPLVRIGGLWREGERLDLLSFDNEDGGYRATNHLIERGCKSIAYLGVHVSPLASSAKEWSSERERGWARALRKAGLPYHAMAFSPREEANDDAAGARAIGRGFADELLNRGDIRGVVAANDAVALGLIDALCESNVPRDEWPTIVAFDNSPAARRHNITSLHLPWDEIGREAADLVWSRAHNQLPPERQHSSVPMRLIPRLSCREKWPTFSNFSAPVAA